MELDIKQLDKAKLIKADIMRLGAAAPAYTGGQSIDSLRGYLRRYLEPFLRGLMAKGFIENFRIGISPVFFWQPKLRVYLESDKYFEMPLNGSYPITRITRV